MNTKETDWYTALQSDTQYWLGEIKKLMVEQGVNITLDELERLRFNESEVREALSGLTHVTCEDWYDTGYALGRARGWNDYMVANAAEFVPQKKKQDANTLSANADGQGATFAPKAGTLPPTSENAIQSRTAAFPTNPAEGWEQVQMEEEDLPF